MKFIHLADAHLDSPFLGLSFLPSAEKQNILQAANRSFAKIVQCALEEQVDLVLLAGDIFDSDHPSPASQLFFSQQLKRLTDAEVQVVMVFGNHDHMSPNDLLVQPSQYFHLLGADEKVEQVHLQTNSGFAYSVTGFSYLQNHIQTDLASQMPAKNGTEFAFGLFHAGEAAGIKQHDVYAPFTRDDLQRLDYDYFALGHIHHRQMLLEHPLAVYPGNIQGRHSNELGDKGCYLGTVDETSHEVNLQFIKTGQPVWLELQVELSHLLSMQELTQFLLDQLNQQLTEKTYICLRLVNAQFLSDKEVEMLQDTEYWQDLSQQLKDVSYLVKVNLISQKQLLIKEQDRPAFVKAEQELLTGEAVTEVGQDLGKKSAVLAEQLQDKQFQQEVFDLTHSKLQRYLRGLTDETNAD